MYAEQSRRCVEGSPCSKPAARHSLAAIAKGTDKHSDVPKQHQTSWNSGRPESIKPTIMVSVTYSNNAEVYSRSWSETVCCVLSPVLQRKLPRLSSRLLCLSVRHRERDALRCFRPSSAPFAVFRKQGARSCDWIKMATGHRWANFGALASRGRSEILTTSVREPSAFLNSRLFFIDPKSFRDKTLEKGRCCRACVLINLAYLRAQLADEKFQ